MINLENDTLLLDSRVIRLFLAKVINPYQILSPNVPLTERYDKFITFLDKDTVVRREWASFTDRQIHDKANATRRRSGDARGILIVSNAICVRLCSAARGVCANGVAPIPRCTAQFPFIKRLPSEFERSL
ncbi:hypothetical protein EVAR_90594_1 [Eumeta japonica]|uniref:Uncharacterized protein n=1 Tax=Eumeta variegata TaxID=151549 RepID=A0A4C1SBC7_EUMVA|nr:hypothetical protein EVAR_90594_1 [Eumeta japonica]